MSDRLTNSSICLGPLDSSEESAIDFLFKQFETFFSFEQLLQNYYSEETTHKIIFGAEMRYYELTTIKCKLHFQNAIPKICEAIYHLLYLVHCILYPNLTPPSETIQ